MGTCEMQNSERCPSAGRFKFLRFRCFFCWCPRLMTITLVVALLGGCTNSVATPSSTTEEKVEITVELLRALPPVDEQPLGKSDCQPRSPLSLAGGQVGPEMKGTTSEGVSLYGLVKFPVRVGEEIKMIWRMTGEGDLKVTATAPNGSALAPSSEPRYHTGSNYERPGSEWGVFYKFNMPGCWNLHFTRGDAQGDVWLEVVSV